MHPVELFSNVDAYQALCMITSDLRSPVRPRSAPPTAPYAANIHFADLYERSGPPQKEPRGNSAQAISSGRATRAIPDPRGVVQDTRLDVKENGREAFSKVKALLKQAAAHAPGAFGGDSGGTLGCHP